MWVIQANVNEFSPEDVSDSCWCEYLVHFTKWIIQADVYV